MGISSEEFRRKYKQGASGRVRKRREDDLQEEVFEWLSKHRPEYIAFHPPNGGYRLPWEAKKLKKMGVIPGVSDVIIIDLSIAVDLKHGKNGLTPEQKTFFQKIEPLGWVTGVAYNLEEFVGIVRSVERSKKIGGIDEEVVL